MWWVQSPNTDSEIIATANLSQRNWRILILLFQGIFFVLPCIESYQKVDLRTITLGVPPQEVSGFFRNTMEDLNWIPIHTLHLDIWIYFVKCQNFLRFIFVIELDTWKSEKVHILYLYTNSIHSGRSLIMSHLVNLKIHIFLETPFQSVIHRNN